MYEVDAPDADSAVQVSGEPAEVRVRPLGWPAGKYEWTVFYVQPLEVLDLAWDEYMDRMLPVSLSGRPGPRLPTPTDLMAVNGWSPPELSLLFDAAITAYRDWAEK